MSEQTKPWLTGKPYYCNSCGLGGGEVFACEDGPCEMESEAEAVARRDRILKHHRILKHFCPTCKKHVPSPCVARQNTVGCEHLAVSSQESNTEAG